MLKVLVGLDVSKPPLPSLRDGASWLSRCCPVFGRLVSGVSENAAGIWVGQVFAHCIG